MKTICITVAAIVSLCAAVESRADFATGIPTQTGQTTGQSPVLGAMPVSAAGPADITQKPSGRELPKIAGGITIRPVEFALKQVSVPVVKPESTYFFLDAGDENGGMISLSTTYSPQSISMQSITIASPISSPVPLPPAAILMGSGLAGLFGIRRVSITRLTM